MGSPHSLGKFTLGISLVGIGVKMYKAIESPGKETAMRELCGGTAGKTHTPIPAKRKLHCETCGEITHTDLIKGVEMGPNTFIVITPEEIKTLKAIKTDKLDVIQFVQEDEVDTIYFEDYIYYLAPDGPSNVGAFATFREGLTGKLAIGDYCTGGHDHRVAIGVFNNALVMRYLRPHNEIRIPDHIPQYDAIPVVANPMHTGLMNQLVEKLTGPFNPREIVDTYTVNFKKLVAAKSEGHTFTAVVEAPKAKSTNLEAALLASLAAVEPPAAPVAPTVAVKRKAKKKKAA